MTRVGGEWKYTLDIGRVVAMLFCFWMAAADLVDVWLVVLVWAPTFKASVTWGGK